MTELRPLVLRPQRVVALGLTWRSHAKETGERIDEAGPPVFMRDPASLIASGPVVLPSRSRVRRSLDALEPGLGDELARRNPAFPHLLDYEIELGFTVLEDGRLGWFVANDITVRTVQILGEGMPRRLDFWAASKSFPGTLLVGPTLLVADETPDVELTLRVGGQTRQRARSTDMMYDAAALRRFAGPLESGDVVLTGTPAGVALAVPRWKRVVADVLLDRWGKLAAAARAARTGHFLAPRDTIEMDGGPLGNVRAVVEQEPE